MAPLGIVMFANESWEAVGVRQRELSTWLSERWDVLFVDRFNYRRFPLRHRQCYRQLIVSLRTPPSDQAQIVALDAPTSFQPRMATALGAVVKSNDA
jgi:hypothetical protein